VSADATEALVRLCDHLRPVRLYLEVAGTAEARRVRDDLISQVDDYVLTRLRAMEAAVLTVVGARRARGSDAREQPRRLCRQPRGRSAADHRASVLACNPDDLPV
jgi:hypothetical protein